MGARLRPTPTFITDNATPAVESKAKVADTTIPWAELSQLYPESPVGQKVQQVRESAGAARVSPRTALVECRERLRSISLTHHHHIQHYSPPPPHCQPPPSCSPCCRPLSCQQNSGCKAKRCGVSREPALCGSGIVMFEQYFVDDVCRGSVPEGSPNYH